MLILCIHRKWTAVAILLWMMFQASLFAQNTSPGTIQGTVFDAEDNSPLDRVHVYLSNTTVGTITNESGEFIIQTGLRENFTLVFSHVGYKTKTLHIRLGNDQDDYVEVFLNAAVYDMDGVSITAQKDVEWERNLLVFKEQFIGTGLYARDTEITNPWVIGFQEDENQNLEAYAHEPLLIDNHALGYHIHADLTGFSWNLDKNTGYYTFFHRFTEMESDSWRQRRRWRNQRNASFRGSFEHFLQSLYHNELDRNSFMIVAEDSFPEMSDGNAQGLYLCINLAPFW